MHKAFTNLVKKVSVPIEQAIKMCSLYPAEVMGIDDKFGSIAPGYAAQFLVLDKNDLSLLDVITM